MTPLETDSSLRVKIGYLETRNAYEHHDLTSQVEALQKQVEMLEAELEERPVVFCRIQNGEYERDIMGQVALCTAISAKLFLEDTRIPLDHAMNGKFERYTGEQQ